MKILNKIKALIKQHGLRFIFYFCIAWMITNGWSYLLLALGLWLNIGWLSALAGTYIGLLWLPCTPEKIITVGITLWLCKRHSKKHR